MMIVGFTGTQRGLTKAQTFKLANILHRLSLKKMEEFHHGDCIGADAKAHDLVAALDREVTVIIHPPLKGNKRAFKDGDEECEKREYLDRNQDIVDVCHVLLACPGEKEEQQRSGTWATVRRAKKAHKYIWFIYPDGDDEIVEA